MCSKYFLLIMGNLMHNCLVLWHFDPNQKKKILQRKSNIRSKIFVTEQSEQEHLLIKDTFLLIQ